MPTELTNERIRQDNPHFGPVIRTVESIKPYQSPHFDFTQKVVVGAENSGWPEEPGRQFDAWATYLWSPSRNDWCLGAN
uniref:Uncharacterized protein n=1 Tax=viral metagenome TaxID=1070528 RepID=A0A6H1ZRS2_9ZZZZ